MYKRQHLGQVNNHVQQPQAAQQQHLTQPTNATPILTDYNKPVPIQITLPPQQGATDPQPRVLTIQVPASALQGTCTLQDTAFSTCAFYAVGHINLVQSFP